MFASSKAIRLEALKVAVVPGKSFDLRYHRPQEIYDCILESNSPSLEVLIYLPNEEKPIPILGEDKSERCIKLLNKLHELTS